MRTTPPQLRSGALLGSTAVAALMTGLGVASVSSIRARWLGWVPSIYSAWQEITVIGGVLIALLGVWLAAPARAAVPRQWQEIGVRHSPRSWYAAAAVCAAVAGCAAYLLVLAYMGAVSGRIGFSGPWAVPQAIGMACVVLGSGAAAAALGVTLARLAPSAIAYPAAAIVTYLANVVPVYYSSSPSVWALAAADTSGWDYEVPSVRSSLVRATWWVLVAAALWLVATRGGQISRVTTGLAALSLVMTSGLPQTYSKIPGAAQLSCVGEKPSFCLPESFSSQLPTYQSLAQEVLQTLPPGLSPSAAGTDPGPASTRWFVPYEPAHGTTAPSRVVDPHRVRRELVGAILISGCHQQAPGWFTSAGTYLWWAKENGVDPQQYGLLGTSPLADLGPDAARVEDVAQRLASMSDVARARWFDDNAGQIRTCTLRDVDVAR